MEITIIGPQYEPSNTTVLILGTPQKDTPNFVLPPSCSSETSGVPRHVSTEGRSLDCALPSAGCCWGPHGLTRCAHTKTCCQVKPNASSRGRGIFVLRDAGASSDKVGGVRSTVSSGGSRSACGRDVLALRRIARKHQTGLTVVMFLQISWKNWELGMS